ncbi:MAG: hypothetical protein ABI723_22805 [Bacteroidia bacterium]
MWSTIFYGIGDAFQWFFKILPYIGKIVAIMFWCTIAIGCFYWLAYGMKIENGAKNYLGEHGKTDDDKS